MWCELGIIACIFVQRSDFPRLMILLQVSIFLSFPPLSKIHEAGEPERL